MEFTNSELEIFAQGTEVFMAILNEDGLFKKVNYRWLKRFNLSYEDIIDTSIFELVHEMEVGDFEKLFHDVAKEGQVCHQIITMIDKELKTYAFQLDLTFKDGAIYLVGFDVTDHAREHLSLIDMSRLSKTGAWYYDPIRDKTFWTDETYRIHDLEPGNAIDAEKALSFYIKADKEKVTDLVDKLYTNHEGYDFTGEIITAKGNKKWIRTIAKPIVHDDKIIYITGVTSDRTRLHTNLEKIKSESETRLLALKGIKSGLFDHDLITDTVFYSPDFKGMVGLPDSKSLPETEFRKMIHPKDREIAYQRHLNQLDAPENHYFNYYRLKHNKGDYEHYEVYAWRKKNEKGETIRMIGNLINVNDRVIAEQERTKAKNSLEAMVDNGFIYSMLLDMEGVILMADQRSIDIILHDYGVNPKIEEVKYVNVMPDIFKKTFLKEFEKVKAGQTIRKEVERPLMEGSMQWLDVMYRPVRNENGEIAYLLTNLIDITERKRAEISIREAEQQARSLSQLKSGILSNLSHEIRTPLNGIMGATDLLEKKGLDKDSMDLLGIQKESELRLLKTLTDLVILSDLDAMRLNMRLSTNSVDDLTQVCFEMYNHQANKKKLAFEVTKLDQEVIVLVDKEMMIAALSAVVNNALKYTSKGSVRIVCEMLDRDWVDIKVIDTGIGIREEDYLRIFENFEKDNVGLNYKYEGAGIGLSIAKKFILLMGGFIDVHSVVGKGSEFVIRLPATENN